jgi:hypothetical protein
MEGQLLAQVVLNDATNVCTSFEELGMKEQTTCVDDGTAGVMMGSSARSRTRIHPWGLQPLTQARLPMHDAGA